MWIFTSTGFVSTVQHRDDPARLVVRARDRVSLEPLVARTGAELNPWRGSDYAYRVVVDRADFEAWLADEARAIAYTNYKTSALRARGGDFERTLHRVWDVMHAFQERERHREAEEA
jgi:hypothetical protein